MQAADVHVGSLWEATAPALCMSKPQFEPESKFDVAVIGGGFTGLSTALHLAERGAGVALIESGVVGSGASGRNNGQVIPGLKHDPAEIIALLGSDLGERLVNLTQGTADLVFRLIERHRIQCDPVRKGWIQAAHSQKALRTVLARPKQLLKLGASVETLSREDLKHRIGTAYYHGGWIDKRAGTINPLAYVRGLADAAAASGARIYELTRASGMSRDGGLWRIATPRGAVLADQVVLGTNAYTDGLWRGLGQSVLSVSSLHVATEPLGTVGDTILPGGECVSETRKLAFGFRKDRDGRLIIAGRGPLFGRYTQRHYVRVHRAFQRIMPPLARSSVAYCWPGNLALTLDGLPHLHEPAPGVVAALGYNGRGIAMATAMGAVIADRLSGANRIDFPVTALRSIPGHAFRLPAMAAGVAYYWLKDRLGYSS